MTERNNPIFSNKLEVPRSVPLGFIYDIRYLLIAIRPEQWIKNLFIFGPLFFSKHLFSLDVLGRATQGFIFFCLASSSIYLLNDVIDAENDRQHPKKRLRPIASNKISEPVALTSSVLLCLFALLGGFLLGAGYLLVLSTYLALNVLYTFKMKRVVILDILFISCGFILRILAGATLAGVQASDWLIVCTMTLSLFLGFSKRRQELLAVGDRAGEHRSVLSHYSIPFLDQMISVATASTVISYALYTVSPETITRAGGRNLIFTIPFVLYGIFRYLYLTYHKQVADNPSDVVLSDKPFIINSALWLVVSGWILY